MNPRQKQMSRKIQTNEDGRLLQCTRNISERGTNRVSECPRVAVTNCHKLGDLKQQKLILSQFWRPKV